MALDYFKDWRRIYNIWGAAAQDFPPENITPPLNDEELKEYYEHKARVKTDRENGVVKIYEIPFDLDVDDEKLDSYYDKDDNKELEKALNENSSCGQSTP